MIAYNACLCWVSPVQPNLRRWRSHLNNFTLTDAIWNGAWLGFWMGLFVAAVLIVIMLIFDSIQD